MTPDTARVEFNRPGAAGIPSVPGHGLWSGRRTRWRWVSALAAVGMAGALAACSPGYSDQPIPVEPGGGTGGSTACAAAFPASTGAPDLGAAQTVPEHWPQPPVGSELCVVLQTSDTTAVLQYVTTLQPDEVLDHYEPLLSGYAVERTSGSGGQPALAAAAPGLELAIQTDPDTMTYVVTFRQVD